MKGLDDGTDGLNEEAFERALRSVPKTTRGAIEAKLDRLSVLENPTTAERNLMRDCEIALGLTTAKLVTVSAAWKRVSKAVSP